MIMLFGPLSEPSQVNWHLWQSLYPMGIQRAPIVSSGHGGGELAYVLVCEQNTCSWRTCPPPKRQN